MAGCQRPDASRHVLAMRETIGRIDKRLAGVEGRVDRLESTMLQRFDRVESDVASQRRILLMLHAAQIAACWG
jgi:hypothetical protein